MTNYEKKKMQILLYFLKYYMKVQNLKKKLKGKEKNV